MWHEELYGRLLQNALLAVRMALKFYIPSDCKCIKQATVACDTVVNRTGTLPVHVSDNVVAKYRDFACTRQTG